MGLGHLDHKMLHILMTLLIYGVDTESAKCPETCTCVEILVSDNPTNVTLNNFDVRNISETSSSENFNAYRSILNSVTMNEGEVVSENKTFYWNYKQPTKKCAKNKENIRDIFIYNFSTKSSENSQINNNSKFEIRTKRTLKLNVNNTVNTKKLTKRINKTVKDMGGSGGSGRDGALDGSGAEKESENPRNKEIFTYQITCKGVRDLKSLWLRYLPNPTTQLNIRGTYFQSFKAFHQILRESPIKLNQLTVLSVSDSIINQKLEKKYPAITNAENKDEKPEEKTDENKHLEFLPFASLQNPKLRSKPELELPAKGGCKNLQVLNLVNNTITYLPQDTFYLFQNLQILNLSNNLLQFIDDEMFSPLVNLLELDIHNNKLGSLNENMFKNLSKLLFLDVSQNLISNVAPSTFQYLISLNILNLASNPLSEKQETMVLLGTGKRLQIVDISKTGLKQIPGTLERSVRVLNLMGNHLLSIRCGDLDSYSLLSYLNLKGNKISYVEDDALGRLEFLNNLQISENNLFQIPKSLPNNLEILNLSYNNIQNITNLDFLNLSLLKELSISNNQVSNIEGNAFNNLVHLKVLDLSRNPILILPNMYGLLKLTVLNLSYFTNIPGSFSGKYKQFPVQSPENIQHLNLESSPVLTKIFLQDTKTLQSFINLQELDLRFTNLTTIRKDIFSLLPRLKILKVEGNPWHCGKEILILSDWLKVHENEEDIAENDEDEMNTAHCSTPQYLYKTTLTTLVENDFVDFNRKVDPLPELNKTQKETLREVTEKVEVEHVTGKITVSNISGDGNNGLETSKKGNVKKYNKNSENVKIFSSEDDKRKNSAGENCCGKSEEKVKKRPSEKNSTVVNPLPDRRMVEKISPANSSSWNDNSTDYGAEVKNSVELKTTQVSFRTVKKAEAVTAKDTLTLKKEYNSHLSFLILSSVGLVVMATLAFTSIYFSRTRRDQSYQRQNQDIEVCSISSLGNELW